MSDEMARVFGSAFWIGFAAWFIWRTVKTFGWEGTGLKFALMWDGLLVLDVIVFRQIPFTRWIEREPPGGIALWFLGGAAVGAFIGYFYILLSDRPTRWLITRPRVKWLLYATAALLLVRYGIRKGWF